MIAWTNTLMADRERIDDKHIKISINTGDYGKNI